jgi:hypothetical protein
VRLVVLALLAACSEKTVPIAKTDPPNTGSASPIDLTAPDQPRPEPDDVPHVEPQRPRGQHPIQITLRTSPPGASAAVDGTPVGTTPAYWSGDADGREHEFTFDLRGYALARYRFVPITSGVIHARLDPIAEETDAGVAISPEATLPHTGSVLVAPPPAPVTPDAYVPPPAPIVPPDSAAPVAPPADTGSAVQSPPPPIGPTP